jgi:hypothetical protein
MREKHLHVKAILLAALCTFLCANYPIDAAENTTPQLHMVYFYNPSCRLCTKTNQAVSEAEEKFKGQITSERFNIADPKNGLDYMDNLFTMLDELGVPEDVSTLLTVVVGVKEVENGKEIFVPMQILMEEDDIAGNVDKMLADFIDKMAKGGNTLGSSRPAGFFRTRSPGVDAAG